METLQPVACRIDRDDVGPTVQRVIDATGVTHGAWVPVCPDGTLHGVLGIASRDASIPDECVARCVALGHFLELALSNWAAHRLRLVIEDDGCGFDPRQERAGGFGLQSMRERAASVGADLSVESAPEHGTRMAVAFR